MFPDPTFTLADQLFWIVDLFRKAMAGDARTRGLGALSIAIWQRVKGFERRFCALYAMWKAGTLPLRSSASSAVNSLDRGERGETQREGKPYAELNAVHERPASVLPRAFRWLQRMLPSSAATLAAGVESLLGNYPEMKAFVADCPQVGRVLRPMCRMAGLKVPEWLALPKRGRVSKEDTSPRPSPRSGEGEVRRGRRSPKEIAEALVRRSERTGKPVDIRKVSSVVWGYIVHPPRDGNCPPPEIGYGGRWRKLPKDYKPPDRD